jgi:hypothetical protein
MDWIDLAQDRDQFLVHVVPKYLNYAAWPKFCRFQVHLWDNLRTGPLLSVSFPINFLEIILAFDAVWTWDAKSIENMLQTILLCKTASDKHVDVRNI